MVRGETYDKQLFESEAFRHFINIFLNKQSGVTKGCEVTKETGNILVGPGSFVIQGGFLREVTGTKNEIPSEAGYYKLVYEVDLSKTNTKDEFKQGSYKFVKALGDYPKLIQEDLDNGGTIYQLPFCQFRVTEAGLQDFKDLRELIEYRIFQKNVEEAIKEATEKNIITATSNRKTVNISTSWGTQTLPLNDTEIVGNKLTVINNTIVIGKGVTKIKCSATCRGISLTLQGDKTFHIEKNSQSIKDHYFARSK